MGRSRKFLEDSMFSALSALLFQNCKVGWAFLSLQGKGHPADDPGATIVL